MQRWLTGRQLIKQFRMKDFELIDLVRNGLQPYSRHDGTPLRCPQAWHALTAKSERLSKLKRSLQAIEGNERNFREGPIVFIPNHGEKTADELRDWLREEIAETLGEMKAIRKDVDGILSWKYLEVPGDNGLKKLKAILCVSCYREEDVERMVPQHGLSTQVQSTEPETIEEYQHEEDQPTEPPKSEHQVDSDQLDAMERRELGRLRQEELKRDVMLRAMAYAVEFCIHHKEKNSKKVTKDQLFDALRKAFREDLPETAYEKIRLAIREQFPGKYLKVGGRPSGQR